MAWSHPTAQGINSAVLERKGREGEREEGKARKKKKSKKEEKKGKERKGPWGENSSLAGVLSQCRRQVRSLERGSQWDPFH